MADGKLARAFLMPEWAWITIACVATGVVVGTVTYLVTVWYLTRNLLG